MNIHFPAILVFTELLMGFWTRQKSCNATFLVQRENIITRAISKHQTQTTRNLTLPKKTFLKGMTSNVTEKTWGDCPQNRWFTTHPVSQAHHGSTMIHATLFRFPIFLSRKRLWKFCGKWRKTMWPCHWLLLKWNQLKHKSLYNDTFTSDQDSSAMVSGHNTSSSWQLIHMGRLIQTILNTKQLSTNKNHQIKVFSNKHQ